MHWLPLITDPHFYAVAIPAVILLGVSKSGFGAGFGSLAVPLMALAVSVPQAAATLMPVLLLMDLMGMAAFRGHVDRALLRFLLWPGLLGVGLGALLFRVLEARVVAGVVGVVTLLFLAQRLLWRPRADAPPPPRWLGRLLSCASGFTSFIAHAGGPPMNAYILPLRLPPLLFTGTLAFYFFFINLAKWVPYAWLGLLDLRHMSTSLVLLPFAPLGVWIGVRIAHRIDQRLFYRLVHVGMLLTGCKLVWDAWR
jgi:uncharacterized membrane protein YfcA